MLAFVPKPFDGIFLSWGVVYFWLAMRRVYAGRWWTTTLRYMTISFVYPLLLILLICATLVAAIFV
jgi:hypothetical protein